MNGVDIMGHLLRGYTPLTAVWPESSIKAGALSDSELGILVQSVGARDWQSLAAEPMVHTTELVSVTVRAKSYREQRLGIKLIRRAAAGVIAAEIGEARGVAVLTAGTGPDALGPGDTFEQAQTFRVSFNAPA